MEPPQCVECNCIQDVGLVGARFNTRACIQKRQLTTYNNRLMSQGATAEGVLSIRKELHLPVEVVEEHVFSKNYLIGFL